MTGPTIVCFACGSPTGEFKPFCDDCARFWQAEVGYVPFCTLCEKGYTELHGLHYTKSGGYAGRCQKTQPPQGSIAATYGTGERSP
jgi:predicted amidophosphoribosyltransferase